MNTGQRRALIINAFNHYMDGNARRENPNLSEEERYNLAIEHLASLGVVDISENDMVHALANAQNAHIKRMTAPARDGHTISAESATRANSVVNTILDIFVKKGKER